jgi:hypothetical protein
MLPSQVDSVDELEPGTWLISEVDGSIALKLGAEYGYNFNWIKKFQQSGISGDIGLKLQLGVTAALGFDASGKYAVILSRDSADDSNKELRLRLFKQRTRGWNFALNANATVTTRADLPEPDDLIKAVFGVHAAQALTEIEKWTDPSKKLSEILAVESVDYGQKLLEDATGINPEELFNEARNRLMGFINQWNQLPNNVATRLWKIVETGTEDAGLKDGLEEIRSIADEIARANQDTIKGVLGDLLKRVDFFQTPAGSWLISAASGRILSALTGSAEFKKLQEIAGLTRDILSGEALESVLVRLQKAISDRLDLSKLTNVVNETTFNKIDGWLKARLEAFLDEKLDLEKVDEIRKTINTLLGRRQEFYDAALKALNRKYQFEFSYTYSSTTTGTALLDVAFDFAAGDVSESLKQAIRGRFDQILVEEITGVTINEAALTHQITRSSHVELNMPFFSTTIDTLNSSVAKMKIEEDDGRVLVYELQADDIVTTKNKRDSRLTVGGFFRVPTNQVRVHSTDELTYSYSFRQVKMNMKRADLQLQIKPYVELYFPKEFSVTGDGTFESLISTLDRAIDARDPNGVDNFGNTLLSLEVSLPAAVSSAWFSPGVNRDRIMGLSRRLQAVLKGLIKFYYFQDVDNFDEINAADVLLVYAAIPPTTSLRKVGSQLIEDNQDPYWDFQDVSLRASMVGSAATAANLAADLTRIRDLLLAHGKNDKADHFKPQMTGVIQGNVARGMNDPFPPATVALLKSLLIAESAIINSACDAAGLIHDEFLPAASSSPTEAIKAFAEFGSKVTAAFNSKIGNVFVGDALRPLGSMIFIEAARALDPSLGDIEPSAMLDMIVVKQQSQFVMPKFLEGEVPGESDIVIQHRLVNGVTSDE